MFPVQLYLSSKHISTHKNTTYVHIIKVKLEMWLLNAEEKDQWLRAWTWV